VEVPQLCTLQGHYQTNIFKITSAAPVLNSKNHPENLITEAGILEFISGNRIRSSDSRGANPKS